ncbi:Mitotic exit network interactor 1, partial [Caligus rogercresseyi]
MFKFNFKVDKEDRSEEFKDDSNECEKISNTEESEKLVWLESKEHFISENHQDRLMDFKFFEEFI